jgi:hypothetical protein
MSTYRPAELLRDHARPRNAPTPTNAAIDARLTEIIAPATYALVDQYRRLGLRGRVLTLPVMVCLLVTLVWRQVPAVTVLAGILSREHLLWSAPRRVSQQALNLRLRSLPPTLFRDLLHQVLPVLQRRAAARTRPRPAVIDRTLAHVTTIWAVDATTLEALFKRVGLLKETADTVLGGKLLGILDIATKLPVEMEWDDDATINERTLLDRSEASIPPGTLLLMDKGFFGFALFDQLTERGVHFIIPDRATTVPQRSTRLSAPAGMRDEVLTLGVHRSNPCRHPVRRITITVGERQYRYLTNMIDPTILPAIDVVDLYRRRWRIEEAFLVTKRLLGLSYLWTGAVNGIALQLWTTWLLYAILVDLTDQVAEILDLPLHRISLEMVFRSLYFFVGAASRGDATDPAAYLAAQSDLGIVKHPRPPSALDTAIRALT